MTTPSPSPVGGHSPLPWSLQSGSNGYPKIRDANGKPVATTNCSFRNGGWPAAQANGPLIVHAVNSLPAYQACVEALKWAVRSEEENIKEIADDPENFISSTYPWIIKARAALAQLENVK